MFYLLLFSNIILLLYNLPILVCLKPTMYNFEMYLFIFYSIFYSVFLFIKRSSFCAGSIYLDFNVFERLNSYLNGFSFFYYFFILSLGFRLCLNLFLRADKHIFSLSQYFQGLEWTEREISEMFGIQFLFKKDNRKLLLDFGFFYFPLIKSYSLLKDFICEKWLFNQTFGGDIR